MNEISSIQTRRPDHFARWERVRERLRASYGEAIFKSWLQPLEAGGRKERAGDDHRADAFHA
jgi:hypothetical protein